MRHDENVQMNSSTKKNRREGHHMTMTTIESNIETTNFQIGDRVRVTKGNASEIGYEGVITEIPANNGDDCVVATDHGSNLSYRFGNLTKVEAPLTMGDRVQVVGNSPDNAHGDHHYEIGTVGTISHDPVEGDPIYVRAFSADFGFVTTQGILAEDLVLTDAELTTERIEEPLAEWEKELLEPTPEPVIEAEAYEVGDIVVLDAGPEFTVWNGLRFPLDKAGALPRLKDAVIDTRPDGYDTDFFWNYDKLRAFDPARDFKVGDIVNAPRYFSAGVVTDLNPTAGGDIEVNWTEGRSSLVAYGPIGASRKYLELVGVSKPEVEPEPPAFEVTVEPEPEEPAPLVVGDRVKIIDTAGDKRAVLGALGEVVETRGWDGRLVVAAMDSGVEVSQYQHRFERTDIAKPEPEPEPFVFEAGMEIGSSDVLADLPMGTVLVIGGDTSSPIVTLGGNRFGRINRYSTPRADNPSLLRAYDETARVNSAADSDAPLMIVFAPSVSL